METISNEARAYVQTLNLKSSQQNGNYIAQNKLKGYEGEARWIYQAAPSTGV